MISYCTSDAQKPRIKAETSISSFNGAYCPLQKYYELFLPDTRTLSCSELLSYGTTPRTWPNRPACITYTAPLPFNCSRCFSTARFESRYRSTQFCVHDSSPEASFPVDIFPVMHFLKHISVRLWTAMNAMLCQPCKLIVLERNRSKTTNSMGIKTSNDSRKRLFKGRTFLYLCLLRFTLNELLELSFIAIGEFAAIELGATFEQ